MKLIKKILLPALICFCSIILTYRAAFAIAENFFFDKLFYKKSAVYGYQSHDSNLLKYPNNQLIEKRITDLRLLTKADLNKDPHVLGVSSEDDYRIAIIGDSFVYGTGVKQAERFPELLEKKLNSYRKTQVFVLAQPGDGMLENYAKFLLAKENIDPDLFIIGLLHNDLLIDNSNKYPRQQTIYENLKQVCLQPEFKYSWPNYQASIQELIVDGFYPSSKSEYANICYFDKIIVDMTKNPVLFFSFHSNPSSYLPATNDETEQKSDAIVKQYSQIIKNHQGKIAYFDDRLQYQPVSHLENHPSVKTHQGYSDLLIKEIIENPQYHFLP
ncbi:hypothetical protein KJ654_02025 [Patescibacteria group bacterium]|nr:hypothetical protein [Patescibacteria group bacterium]MBU1967391.1 hypothetical protein [Patescibacteria group bacterium]